MSYDQTPSRGNHFSGAAPQTPRNTQTAGYTPRPSNAPQDTTAFLIAHDRSSQQTAGRTYQQASAQGAGRVDTSQFAPAQGSPRGAYGSTAQTPYSSAPRPNPYGGNEKKGGAGKIVAIVLSFVLLGLLAFGGTTGYFLYRDVKSVKAQAQTIVADAKSLKDYLKYGNGEKLISTAASLRDQVGNIHETLSGPAWTIASYVPVYGDDVRYVRGLIEQADILANDALVPACDNLANFQLSNLISDGTVDIDLLESVIDTLQEVEPTLASSIDAIKALPEPHIGKAKAIADGLGGPLTTAGDALGKINDIAPVLPQMLGADGQTRTYLVLAQQNAELRSTGGLPGSVGCLTITNGKIEMGDFVAGTSVAQYPSPRFGVTDEEAALFTNRMGRRITDTNFNPDFPRVCHFIVNMWEEEKDQDVDGVVAIDPIFLQYLVKLTGSIQSEGIEVNGDNAARLLLHDAYNKLPNEKTDAFFSSVAGTVFDSIMGNLGNVGITDLAKVIGRSIDEHRLLVWMENEAEEQAMQELGCAGELKTDETKPELGVYVSDDTFAKINWFFSYNTDLGEGVKNADGTTTYHVTTTMQNHLTLDEARQQDKFVTGFHRLKRDLSDMYMHVYLVAPAGGTISNIQTEGDFSQQEITEMPYREFTFFTGSPRIKGGETVTITYDVTVSANATEPLTLRETPTAQVVAGWDTPEQSE